jgi:hypothetical protein
MSQVTRNVVGSHWPDRYHAVHAGAIEPALACSGIGELFVHRVVNRGFSDGREPHAIATLLHRA